MSLDVHLYTEIDQNRIELFDTNITHNLGGMASEADIYTVLWRIENTGVKTAKDMIKPLMKGITAMKKDPERFRKFDAPNGWGTYDQFLPWLEELLSMCEKFPSAEVETCR